MDCTPSQQEQKRKAIKAAEAWRKPGIEPKLDDILSEPLVIMMMQRDGVTTNDIQEMMHVMPAHPNKLALRTTQTAA
ncbi:MAG: hypothetical protein ACR2Q4_21665 [Geminicoccaceae bacterium]